ncbi:MAG: winged helix-turn-helix domain-containing protein [Rhodospirillales bacterium]
MPLSSRAFDILLLLVEKRGRVVSKDEILATVWRGMIVEENNLAVQVSALRRALAEGCETALILTVPGHGYRFVGEIARPAPPAPPAAAPVAPPPLPTPQPPPAVQAATTPQNRILALAVALRRRRNKYWPPPCCSCGAAQPPPASSPPRVAPRLSIAVLPFRDLSDDRCCDYLADAISDDLTTDLSHIPGSVVIARESSDVFRGRALPTAEIGRTLNVRYLLEGSLRAVEGQFSINAQLIEATSGVHLWAERFTVPRDHLADAQDGIVRRLTSALGVKLVDIEGARAARERALTPDALDLYLRGRSILDRTDTLEGMTQAQALLEQALAKQPDDVKVLSELAWLLATKVNNFVEPHPADDLAAARRFAARALALAPDDPNALAAQGAMLAFDGKCTEAEHLYQSALASDPANIRALTGLVVCHGSKAEFRDMADRLATLVRIDPEAPRKRVRYQQLGFAELMLGHASDALPWLERALADAPIEPRQRRGPRHRRVGKALPDRRDPPDRRHRPLRRPVRRLPHRLAAPHIMDAASLHTEKDCGVGGFRRLPGGAAGRRHAEIRRRNHRLGRAAIIPRAPARDAEPDTARGARGCRQSAPRPWPRGSKPRPAWWCSISASARHCRRARAI